MKAVVDALHNRTGPMPPFAHHISRVVSDRAEKQVVGPNTGRVIAPMAYEHAGRNRSKVELVTKAMGTDELILVPEAPVARFSSTAGPLPALVGLDHICPESLPGIAAARNSLACSGAITPQAATHIVGSAEDSNRTHRAGHFGHRASACHMGSF